MQNQQNLLATLIPIIVLILVFGLRMRRMAVVRPMRLQRLWIRPAMVSVIAGILIYGAPPHGALQVLVLVAALAAGTILGWHQGKLMEISVHSETGMLQVKASIIALVVFFGLILVRVALRPWLTGATSPVHAYVGVVTDCFMLVIVGFYAAQAAEMFIRGRALLTAARTSAT